MAGERMAGSGGFGGGGFQGFQGTVDPEELFRKIFGDMGFQSSGFGGLNDFAESQFGFAAAKEVCHTFTIGDK